MKGTDTGPSILVSGPYGGLNLGDDAIARVISDELATRGARVTLAALDPQAARDIHPQASTVERLNLRRGRLSMLSAIRRTDCVVIGGGEQFQEPRLPNPVWGHLATNLQICAAARAFGRPFATLGVGVDAGLSRAGRRAMAWMLGRSLFTGVRDSDSFGRLSALGVQSPPLFLGADPAFLIRMPEKDRARSWVQGQLPKLSGKPLVTVFAAHDKIVDARYLKILAQAVAGLQADGVQVVYAVSDLQPGYDLALRDGALLPVPDGAVWWPPGKGGIDGVLTLVAASDCIISARMHPLIFALAGKTPFVCLSRSAKMDALMDMVGAASSMALASLDATDLQKAARAALNVGAQGFHEGLTAAVDTLKRRAARQFDVLMDDLAKRAGR
ncbi:polysaccharide pyruvyl transferase family protein [Methyloversatilis sp. NSM2]|uniref:polysaccharide pyruvyl transferase family protein n=1 Tax=Methyloversatilis sp. NSM2 TaxID=3134135 RepID=UPI00310FC4EC